ncbi:MAG: ATP-binding protein [Myxococcota bacterium]
MEIDASIVLDELVHQFADPMAFFRELIQNAIDAGTGEIDVAVDWEPIYGDPDRGRMTVAIRDFGVGMDRQIIQNELLKLFNSGKDRDLTKIGRFGIGFVSVFAVEPDAVCVDTGRAGESWRVLFDADRSYELFDRDVPFEGTSVRLFKEISKADYVAFQDRAREVIYEWCKHVDPPLYFNDEPLGDAFDIDSPCKTYVETEGTRIVAGYVASSSPTFGYYHSGLTLMEGVGGPWPHVSFKLDSRYLEHTLTRDQIIEDKNFHKALEMLEAIVHERLPTLLTSNLERAAADGDLDTAETLAHVAMWRPARANLWGNVDRLHRRDGKTRALFPIFGGEPVTFADLESADLVLWNREQSPVVAHLPPGAMVLESPAGNLASFASMLLGRDIPHADQTFYFVEQDTPEKAPEQALARALAELLDVADVSAVCYGTIESANQVARRPWIAVENTAQSRMIESLAPMALETLGQAEKVVLNRRNPLVARLVESAIDRPEWSALMLLVLTCPDATTDDPGADALLRRAFRLDVEAT